MLNSQCSILIREETARHSAVPSAKELGIRNSELSITRTKRAMDAVGHADEDVTDVGALVALLLPCWREPRKLQVGHRD
jgi:hypothetical protein